ncbi:MAG: AraC family transcriptional regulator [Bacteroidales bacterium]|nr:AraC family transcriptional regulator [Bacteroidales bacterium]
MKSFRKVPKSGDPSSRLQWFEPLNTNIKCCRYWWLEKWKCDKMSFPYWRLYWNRNEGAYVQKNEKIYLSPEKIVLIPPHTIFATDIDRSIAGHSQDQYDLVGSWVKDKEDENLCLKKGRILHLFIHFNLGNQLDNTCRDIYSFNLLPEQGKIIKKTIDKLLMDNIDFTLDTSLDIYQLILSAINQIPPEKLVPKRMEPRIKIVIDYIHNHSAAKLSNVCLAEKLNMTTNSFTRFFRINLKCSPQEYIRKVRVSKACNLLDHSIHTIDEIAELCGFSDRFHFSKVFKNIKEISPAEYKKRYILNSTSRLD